MIDFERIDCPKHGVKFAYCEECEFPKDPVEEAFESELDEARHWLIQASRYEEKLTAAESRVSELEGLLRDYRNSDCAHLGCYLGQYVNGRKHDYRCDVCMRTDSILAPAPLAEGE